VEANLSIGEEGLGAGVIVILQLEGGHLILELDTVLLGPLYVLLVERLQSRATTTKERRKFSSDYTCRFRSIWG
jgi:uncharacterized membrane protein